ncbi:hypothetical protein ACOSP7_001215 [Xanthoceras sorbifolium]
MGPCTPQKPSTTFTAIMSSLISRTTPLRSGQRQTEDSRLSRMLKSLQHGWFLDSNDNGPLVNSEATQAATVVIGFAEHIRLGAGAAGVDVSFGVELEVEIGSGVGGGSEGESVSGFGSGSSEEETGSGG